VPIDYMAACWLGWMVLGCIKRYKSRLF